MSISPPYVDVSDAVIISDLLYYISNKLHNTPVRTVVSTCHNFYTDDDELEKIEQHDFWPEGVLCGPFFRSKANEERLQPNGGITASASMING